MASWALRLGLVGIFAVHGAGKILSTQAFDEKFGVPAWQALALGAVEVAAAAGMLVGGFAANRWGVRVTRLAALGVVLSQALAIAYAHSGHFLEYAPGGGWEENAALILVAVALALVPGVAWRGR